ncbi:hypothetical protein HMPREF1211_04439 [Streptomyces sp. HGB0020]|nr:hypothetical protein HMPREF1211_04439 [Streptomyces sp. HGB0020]
MGNKRTNTPQLGALRASLVRPDHRRVIFSKHLNRDTGEEYPRLIYTLRSHSHTARNGVRAYENHSP